MFAIGLCCVGHVEIVEESRKKQQKRVVENETFCFVRYCIGTAVQTTDGRVYSYSRVI